MQLLVTNDDGIDSVFLHALVRALIAAGQEPFVVAPRHEQSWVGAAKTRDRAVRSSREERGLSCPTWVVDGTPSDCVNIAVSHLLPIQPEAVVSGINVGLNASLGFILASGTIGGAWEGALHGLPSAALSQDLDEATFEALRMPLGASEPRLLATLAATAKRAAELVPTLLAGTSARRFVVHNLNFPFPCGNDTPVRRTVPARVLVPGLFSPQADDGTHRLIFRIGDDVSPEGPLTDRAALEAGWISHSELDYTRLGCA